MSDKFNPNDFSQDFDVFTYDSYDQPAVEEPTQGVPINAYKQFKAIDKFGNSYYMSGTSHSGVYHR